MQTEYKQSAVYWGESWIASNLYTGLNSRIARIQMKCLFCIVLMYPDRHSSTAFISKMCASLYSSSLSVSPPVSARICYMRMSQNSAGLDFEISSPDDRVPKKLGTETVHWTQSIQCPLRRLWRPRDTTHWDFKKCDNGHFQYKIVHFGFQNRWGLKPYFAQAELPHQQREENKGDHLKVDKICKREKIFCEQPSSQVKLHSERSPPEQRLRTSWEAGSFPNLHDLGDGHEPSKK